ncbi:HIRAN domain-containing protein [Mesobacillus subterraneus]|uniref:HIRAN domain-containing protein n=1 Tax=Mesobacillus subterraneus TaxID=285983 RepID=UPI00203A574F|nr:HIRAN domain-containing protein [Mesobacillus subterraneus]MCM3572515.1 HIRAN domain-containing protein [Mesobacillus subterraneus]
MIKFFKKLLGGNEKVPSHTKIEPIPKPSNLKNNINENTYFVAPISTDPSERGINKEYRLESDNHNVIRINQEQPKGFPKKAAEFVPVVGISMNNRTETAIEFIKGTDRRIELQKEPDNEYDKNAIVVVGHWVSDGESKSGKLGYLPKEIAAKLAKLDELRATLKVMYTPINEENAIGIRIDVWSKREKKEVIAEKPYKTIKIPRDPVKRNLLGKDLEKEGYVDNAIELYEINVKERFSGNFPYDRLATIYRKRKQYGEEIRVLEQAVSVFEELSTSSQRQDVKPKLDKFRERLEKVRSML